MKSEEDALKGGRTTKSKQMITHKSQDGDYFLWGEKRAQRVSGWW